MTTMIMVVNHPMREIVGEVEVKEFRNLEALQKDATQRGYDIDSMRVLGNKSNVIEFMPYEVEDQPFIGVLTYIYSKGGE